jgi:hypothetical protein
MIKNHSTENMSFSFALCCWASALSWSIYGNVSVLHSYYLFKNREYTHFLTHNLILTLSVVTMNYNFLRYFNWRCQCSASQCIGFFSLVYTISSFRSLSEQKEENNIPFFVKKWFSFVEFTPKKSKVFCHFQSYVGKSFKIIKLSSILRRLCCNVSWMRRN